MDINIIYKYRKCSKCGVEKPYTIEYYDKDKKTCKICRSIKAEKRK